MSSKDYLASLFDLSGLTIAITGGAGVLCGGMGKALSQAGARIALLDLFDDKAKAIADEINTQGGQAVAIKCNVLETASIQAACDATIKAFGRVDVLINGAGGNKKEATTSPEMPFFNMPPEAVKWVFDLNILGTIMPSQVFGKAMADRKQGQIVNISSMSAFRPLTRVAAYSAAKAAVSNFTQWLAVHIAQEYSTNIRVNAIAPGFFLTEQNRFLLTDEKTGALTPRGQKIIDHTPMGKFGVPDDLMGGLIWLLSPSASFVHGIVLPIDGGFAAYSGV